MSQNRPQTYADAIKNVARDYSVFDADIEGKRLDVSNLRRLLGWLKSYWRRGLVSLAFVLIAASCAVLAPVVISRVLIDGIILSGDVTTSVDFGQRSLNQWLAEISGTAPLATACFLYIFWIFCWALFGHGFRITLAQTVLSGLRDLRRDVFAHLERLPASFYDRVAVGRVMTRVSNDIETLFELLAGFGVLLGEFVPFFVALSIMLLLSPDLTGILALLLPLAAVATIIFRSVSKHVYRAIRSSVSLLNENLQENLSGIEVVQLYGREKLNFDRYTAINEENRRQEARAVQIESHYGPFMDSLVFMAMAAIIWFGGHDVFADRISLGTVILFAQFTDMLFRPIVAMGEQWNVVFRAMASLERILQTLDWDEQLSIPSEPLSLPEKISGQVEFRHLTFEYRGGHRILNDVSLTIEPGEKIAIVGPTGSGKTTIIRLLSRFYDVPPGSIFIDGIDIMDVDPAEIRRKIGVVLQDFHIFSGSVYENISLGDTAITRQIAERAALDVRADEFIRSLPQGYDSVLTERGRNLSHGQRQLLAFARVLAMDPQILILDEATASVDTQTEQLIQTALDRITAGRTSIIIAHRLQTIRGADRIIVLTNGEVREVGTHQELMETAGVYKTLYDLQVQAVGLLPDTANKTTV